MVNGSMQPDDRNNVGGFDKTEAVSPSAAVIAMKQRVRWGWVAGHVLAVLVIILLIGGCIVFPMPGKSFRGKLPPTGPEHNALAAKIKEHIDVLAGQIGERHTRKMEELEAAAKYIEGQLAATGLKPTSLPYQLDDLTVRNIELELPGNGSNAEEIIVIGAHYDSAWGTPAANDNASGIAAVIELARAFKARPHERTIRFVAFVNEEPPWFKTDAMGSMVYAKNCRERGDRIVGMLSLETIGYYSEKAGSQQYPLGALSKVYPSRGDFIGFIGNVGSRELVRDCVGSFREHVQFPCEGIAAPEALEGIGLSDHWSFWRAGYPALMVTDTAMFRYPHYHSPQDTPEKIDYDRMARVVAGLVPVIEDLAKLKQAGTAE